MKHFADFQHMAIATGINYDSHTLNICNSSDYCSHFDPHLSRAAVANGET